MDIMELITSQLSNQEALKKLGKSVNANPSQVEQLTQIGMPVLLEALNRNSNTPQGAEALASALDRHQDDNVDDLIGFLDNVDTSDGEKILQHVLSDKNDRVQSNLAKQTGMDASQVSGLLAQLAPLLLGALGNQKKAQNLDAAGVSNLTSSLTGMLGQSEKGGLLGLATQLLDADKDGSIIDDIGNLIGKFLKK
ncbi:hypothetical protein EAL2_c08000 [Peptoclostridium acidaminophilum DSM 3953]|uniref:DUF937 domain-containing protein n=1 Tax=Peptoclostridium acidaminophilum DSM 3953 TaxID=1286171 RepID=W8T5G8_PEPAC|nr:DUF937 domain-containing protein [Peptoclostridium acidaminophilum]AHM56100.1 hypothetical protein EAL2_c08000 [Peptoclostridium acidaminophilum DSM 3953]